MSLVKMPSVEWLRVERVRTGSGGNPKNLDDGLRYFVQSLTLRQTNKEEARLIPLIYDLINRSKLLREREEDDFCTFNPGVETYSLIFSTQNGEQRERVAIRGKILQASQAQNYVARPKLLRLLKETIEQRTKQPEGVKFMDYVRGMTGGPLVP